MSLRRSHNIAWRTPHDHRKASFPTGDIPFNNTAGVVEAFALDLARVERVGPLARLCFIVPDRLETGKYAGPVENVLVAKILVPLDALPSIAARLVAQPEPMVAEGGADRQAVN